VSPSVGVSKETSRKLDELRARYRLQSGKRVTRESVIEELVNRAFGKSERLILFWAPQYPLPPAVRRRIERMPFDWAVETREEDIDRILYDVGPEGTIPRSSDRASS